MYSKRINGNQHHLAHYTRRMHSHGGEIVKVLLQQPPHLVRFLISNNLVSNNAIRRVLQCHGYIYNI